MTASIIPFDRKVTDEEIKEYVTACTDVAMRLDEYIQRVDEAYYQISVAKGRCDDLRKVVKSLMRRILNAARERIPLDLPSEGHESLEGIKAFLADARLAQPDARSFLKKVMPDDEAHEALIIELKYLRRGFPDWRNSDRP